MKLFVVLLISLISLSTFAFNSRTYTIDNQDDVYVTFDLIQRCPKGGVYELIFSEDAKKPPYSFITGLYLERNNGRSKRYISTTGGCKSSGSDITYKATKSSFNGFSLEEI